MLISERLCTGAFCCLLLLLLTGLAGCRRQNDAASVEAASAQAPSAESEEYTAAEITAGCPEMQKVVDAVEAAAQATSFRIDTSGCLKLDTSLIQKDFSVRYEVHITQKQNHTDMKMSMRSESDLDPVHYACYQDGWYYTDGDDGKSKEEKTADEVLALISGTTALVQEAASKIDTVDVQKNGENTVYTYELPAYLAKKYLKQLAKKTGSSELKELTVDIEQAILISTIDSGGVLKSQTVKVSGSLHKMLFLIPAEAEFTADFQIPDPGKPDIQTW